MDMTALSLDSLALSNR